MVRSHRIAVVAALLVAPAGLPLGAQVADRPFPVVVVQEILDELAHLADTARTETARCLIGVMQGDSAIVDLLWTPRIDFSNRTSVHYRSCPLATIAEWHNHPWTAQGAPEELCYFSRTDIIDGLRRHAAPIQIVQVTADVSCWWGRAQIATARDEPVLRPWVGQSTSPSRPLATSGAGAPAVSRVSHDPRP